MLKDFIIFLFRWVSERLNKPVREAAEKELRADAAADAKRRRTAGEIAAEAVEKAQRRQEEKYDKATSKQKLEELRRQFGRDRNRWV